MDHFEVENVVEVAVDFGDEEVVVEFFGVLGGIGLDFFGDGFGFVVVGGGDVGGEVAAGAAQDAAEGGAVTTEGAVFDVWLIFIDGGASVVDLEQEAIEAVLRRLVLV